MPRKLFSVLLILVVFGLDRASKAWVLENLPEGATIPVTSFFHLTRVNNSGAAFGFLKNSGPFLIVISLICVLALSVALWNKRANLAFPLIVAGALGNLVDRLHYGAVIDFLDFRVWPVFNFADTSITLGVFLAGIEMFRRAKQKEK